MKTVSAICWVFVNRSHNVMSALIKIMFIILLLNGLSCSCIIIFSAINFYFKVNFR